MNNRLEPKDVKDLLILISGKRPLTENIAAKLCTGKDPVESGMQIYGIFKNGDLVATMTAVFFETPAKNLRIAYISDAFFRNDSKNISYITTLRDSAKEDAIKCFKAQYFYDEMGRCVNL